MKGTYKRDYECDFICTEEAVRAMFADQRDVSGDVEILDEFGLDVLNQDTIKGYRIIFEQLHRGHPWNALENDEFLMKLRAAAKNKNGTLSPTIAGLLFFGEAYHITEVFRIISWIIERNAMIKRFVGYFGHIRMKVTGVVIYMTFSARCAQEWMMM